MISLADEIIIHVRARGPLDSTFNFYPYSVHITAFPEYSETFRLVLAIYCIDTARLLIVNMNLEGLL